MANSKISSGCRRGFTLIELLVVIAIIALLVTILMPALTQAKDNAKTTICLANLKSVGQAMNIYSAERNEAMVPTNSLTAAGLYGNTWASTLVQVKAATAPLSPSYYNPTQEQSIFKCPEGTTKWTNGTASSVGTDLKYSDSLLGWTMYWQPTTEIDARTVHTWYSPISSYRGGELQFWHAAYMNHTRDGTWTKTHRISDPKSPSRLAVMFDGITWTWQADIPARMSARHLKRAYTNFLIADGHAETHKTSDTPNNMGWTSGKGDTASYPYFDWRLDQ